MLAIVLSILALGFTIFSFWYIHAWPGRIIGFPPTTWAGHLARDGVTVRLPVILKNTGAADRVILRVRLVLNHRTKDLVLQSETFRVSLDPGPDDIQDMAAAFAIPRRSVIQHYIEFVGDTTEVLEPTEYQATLQVEADGKRGWTTVSKFVFRAWHLSTAPDRYITRRNTAEECRPGERKEAVQKILELVNERWHLEPPSWAKSQTLR